MATPDARPGWIRFTLLLVEDRKKDASVDRPLRRMDDHVRELA
jgi:hypothetical protein